MRPVQFARLADPVPGLADAVEVINGVDAALANGLGRPGPGTEAALEALAAAVSATPLASAVRVAVDKALSGSVHDEHVAVLAGARVAVLGAVHDALIEAVDAALGRSRAPDPVSLGATAPDPALAGARSWLRDLAIAGWRGVDEDVIAGADPAIQAALGSPSRRRLATVLDGLAGELRAGVPLTSLQFLPARRWADLWTRAVVLAQPGSPVPDLVGLGDVSGRLLPLGVDVREHGTAVQVQVHGVLESANEPPRLVRTSVAVGKVESIVGAAIWPLLQRFPLLMRALSERRAIDITDRPLLASGDLLWSEDGATLLEPADPFATARLMLSNAAAFAAAPLDRHPVRIAEPVLIEGYTVGDGALVLGDHRLPLALGRLPVAGPLTAAHLAASSACLGLLRWDGEWRLQPTGVLTAVKKKSVAVHVSDWAMGPTDPKVAKATGDAVAVLRERAGRMLRR
jgi:hypothetical protein